MNSTEKNNRVFIMGEIVSEAKFSHEVFGEGFYELSVKVMRLSGQADILPVTVSERIMTPDMKPGSPISALGQFRSYNKLEGGRSRLMLTVFVRELLDEPQGKNPNSIVLSGYICKPPVYRTTPFKREICDVLLAVNRAYNKSDYIPCIMWGRNARFIKDMPVGERLWVTGRVQSRVYTKCLGENVSEERVAYEVSVAKILVGDRIEEELCVEKNNEYYS